jgi:hypothetical protein
VPVGGADPGPQILRRHPTMAASTGVLVAVTLCIALAAGPLYRMCERTADDLSTPARYEAAVEGP